MPQTKEKAVATRLVWKWMSEGSEFISQERLARLEQLIQEALKERG